MRRGVRYLTLFAVLAIAATMTLAKSNASTAAEAIKKADDAWAAAAAAKDIDKSASFCAPDAAILVPNAPAAEGKDAIRKWFQEIFGIPNFKLIWHATGTDAAKSGDLGYSTGKYELSYTDPSGKTVTDHGKYVTVWQKQSDGSWKVVRDIFNSDVSPSQ